MGMDDIQLGGEEMRKKMAAETTRDINANVTMIALKMTAEDPIEPELTSISSIDEAFDTFKPSVDLEFEDDEGNTHPETVLFPNLGTMTPKGIGEKSEVIGKQQLESDIVDDFIKVLTSSKTMQKALEDPEAKKAIVEYLNKMAEEIPE